MQKKASEVLKYKETVKKPINQTMKHKCLKQNFTTATCCISEQEHPFRCHLFPFLFPKEVQISTEV